MLEAKVQISDNQIQNYLGNLGERQLLSLLMEVLSHRNPKKQGSWITRLCIEDEGRLFLIANGSRNWVEDATLCQFGSCCNIPLTSWAKNAICPICGMEVFLS